MYRRKRVRLNGLLVFLFLAALPALACSTLSGSGEDEGSAVVVEATVVAEEAAVAEPVEAPTEALVAAPTETSVEEPTSVPAEEPTLAPTEESEPSGDLGVNALESIITAQRSGLDVDALRIEISTEDLDSGESVQSTFEFIKPDRFHMASEGFEIIMIGDATYIKEDTGTWIESPVPMGEMFAGVFDAFTDDQTVSDMLEDLEVSIDNLQFLGQETVNGKDTQVYEYTAASTFDESIVSTRVWVGADDGRLYKQVIQTDAEGARGLLTFVYSYGEDVTIEAPIP